MKRIRLVLVFLICSIAGFSNTIRVGLPCPGNDITENLTAAFNSAASKGDEIILPEGTFTFTGSINTTKCVSLTGQGLGLTVLIRPESMSDATLNKLSTMITYNINSDIPSGINIKGITFKSKIPSLNNGSDGHSISPDIGIKMVNAVNFRIHHCRFENFGNGAVDVRHKDLLAKGLIDHNEFNHNAKGSNGLGLGYGIVIYGESKVWSNSVMFGTDNFIFVEDNVFDYHRHSIAAAGCSRYVFRYNLVRNNIISPPYSHCIDGHESRGPGNGINTFGSRATEIYNNTIINPTRTDGSTPIADGVPVNQIEERAIGILSGDAVIHHNNVSGYRFAIGVLVTEGKGTYPSLQQIGWASGVAFGAKHTGTDSIKGAGDLFAWANSNVKIKMSNGSYTSVFYNYDANGGTSGRYLKQGRDYQLVAKPGYKPYQYPHDLIAKMP